MPTTIQNPQLMCPPFLRPLRANAVSVFVLDVDHDGSRKLVVPTLLALVQCDPEKTQEQGNDRSEVSEVAPHGFAGGGRPEGAGIHYPRREGHLPGRPPP